MKTTTAKADKKIINNNVVKSSTSKLIKKPIKKGRPTLNFQPIGKGSRRKLIRKNLLHWKNSVTGNIIGYARAHYMGLTNDENSVWGVLNPKTNKLVSVKSAKVLGLI